MTSDKSNIAIGKLLQPQVHVSDFSDRLDHNVRRPRSYSYDHDPDPDPDPTALWNPSSFIWG